MNKSIRVGDIVILNRPSYWGEASSLELHGELGIVIKRPVLINYIHVFHSGPPYTNTSIPRTNSYLSSSENLIFIDHFTKKEMDALKLDEL